MSKTPRSANDKQCKTCIHMDASHLRKDHMCMPQVFEGSGYKTVLDNIPCRFYEQAPPTRELPIIGKVTTTLVWDKNIGKYVDPRQL